MADFTPVTGLVGGLLIGSAAASLVLLGGQILGASGIVSTYFLHPCKTVLTHPDQQWKTAFLAAFLVTAKLWATYGNASYVFDAATAAEPYVPVVSATGHGLSGFFVGFGTRLGNGCTSGHGVCGMARMSLRSFANVGAFMLTGFLTASLCGPGTSSSTMLRASKADIPNLFPTAATRTAATVLVVLSVASTLPGLFRPLPKAAAGAEGEGSVGASQEVVDRAVNDKRRFLPGMISGVLFAAGLAISGMIKTNKIFGFLDLTGFARGTFDATLVFVLGGAVLVSLVSYQFVPGFNLTSKFPKKQLDCPLALKQHGTFSVPTNKTIDLDLLLGGAVFGVGWGIGGLCPGPAMWMAAAGFRYVLVLWWPFCLLGAFVAEQVKDVRLKLVKGK